MQGNGNLISLCLCSWPTTTLSSVLRLFALILLAQSLAVAAAAGSEPNRWAFKPASEGNLPSAGIIAKPYILTVRCDPKKRGGRALTLVYFKADAAKQKRHSAKLASLQVRIDGRSRGEVLASKRKFKEHLIFASFVDMARDTRRVVRGLRRARRRIEIEVNGEVARFPVRGSTRTLKQLARACRL